MVRRIKNWLIYYLTLVAVMLVGMIPTILAARTGRLVGALAHAVARKERILAERHLSMALNLPSSGHRVKLLTRGVFSGLGRNAVELCRLVSSPNKSPEVVIPKASTDALDNCLAEGKGVVFVTGHLGNWELMAIKLAVMGYPISTVAKESYDSRFTRLIEHYRRGAGIQAIYRGRPGSSAAMLRALRNNRVLGFLMDQDTSVPSAFVPFFGRPAHTPIGAATFALRTFAPVVVGTIRRTTDGSHLVEITPCLIPDDVEGATARLTKQLETRIRRHPSQWVWFHRRWKTEPGKGAAV